VQQAESAVVAAKTDVVAAERQEQVDRAAGRVSIENARQGVVSAQNDRASASSDRPYNVAEQQALVDDARAGVAGARRDVEETSLTAPVAGVVAAINGVPGEFVPAPSGVTPQGPGGTPLPPLADVSGTASEAPETGTFLVLAAANAFEVVVPLEETDAARVVVGQQVDIGLDAVPDAALHGRVLAMAPTGQDLNGIVSFYTTISIEDPIDRLRTGQTATVKVRTQVAQNVLRVPTTAVGRTDGRPSVTVTNPDGDPVTVPFEPGLVGDDFTEVRSGLQPGQDVRLPQATVTATPDRGGPGGGDGGGG
jgi:HlyD family secretion protein